MTERLVELLVSIDLRKKILAAKGNLTYEEFLRKKLGMENDKQN